MDKEKRPHPILKEDIPAVLSKDRLPVLQNIVATQPGGDKSIFAATSSLKMIVDALIDQRIDQLAGNIEQYFEKLETSDQPLTTAEIGQHLAAALRQIPAKTDEDPAKDSEN